MPKTTKLVRGADIRRARFVLSEPVPFSPVHLWRKQIHGSEARLPGFECRFHLG